MSEDQVAAGWGIAGLWQADVCWVFATCQALHIADLIALNPYNTPPSPLCPGETLVPHPPCDKEIVRYHQPAQGPSSRERSPTLMTCPLCWGLEGAPSSVPVGPAFQELTDQRESGPWLVSLGIPGWLRDGGGAKAKSSPPTVLGLWPPAPGVSTPPPHTALPGALEEQRAGATGYVF